MHEMSANKTHSYQVNRLLQVIETPSQRWEDIAIDFIVGLSFSGNTIVIVVIDLFHKRLILECYQQILQHICN